MPMPTFPLARLGSFRTELHACFPRRADALFELGDALLCAQTALPSLPHLSLEPVHQRGWGSVYAALACGRIDAERLRDLLELESQRRDLKTVSARVSERSVDNWSSTLTLNRGTSAGIAIGNCAIDQYGDLVGVVTDAGLNWCTVTTVLDTSSAIGAKVFRTEQVAVAQGQLSLMTQGQLSLTYLESAEDLISGDLVVTSGLGGYYPAGLTIGTVEELRTDADGLTQYAAVTPKAAIASLTQVFLITEFDVVE